MLALVGTRHIVHVSRVRVNKKKSAFFHKMFCIIVTKTAIVSLIIVSRDGYDGKQCVYCEVRTESLNIIQMDFVLHSVKDRG